MVKFCYQLIHRDDGIFGSNGPISDSNEISHCSDLLTNEESTDMEVFPILSSLNIEIITISDTESETD